MNTDLEGHRYPPFRLRADRDLGRRFLEAQGADGDLPPQVPPTYMIFLRGETRGANLFADLGVPRQKALHGGQRYEWFAPIGWDEDLDVTVTIDSIVEKAGRSGRIWFADVSFDYARAEGGETVLREITRLIERE